MKVIADLHFHSKYSRAVSPQMVLPEIARWAQIKGIDLLGTGDFTHPLWIRELKSQLEEAGKGIYKLKVKSEKLKVKEETKFLLSTEISSIYSQGGRGRRIHTLVLSPSFETVEKINRELLKRGANLMSDGRPIIGLSARDLAELVLTVDENCLVIPAHAWTPWFSLYGSQSGFDSIEECFGDMAKCVFAVETGLSSDPAMNWRVGELDNRSIISCSDAHSGAKLGREATVFQIKNEKIKNKNDNEKLKISYEDITGVIKQSSDSNWEIGYTIEFYPEEGKYHYTGHRVCGVRQSPGETNHLGTICPACGKKLTVGVMHRVEQLAAREVKSQKLKVKSDKYGVRWIHCEEATKPPYVMLVPLLEILAESIGMTINSQKVINEYKKLTEQFGGEFTVLLAVPLDEITKFAGPRMTEGISRVRSGQILIEPGYDGVFGVVKIWSGEPSSAKATEGREKEQLGLF